MQIDVVDRLDAICWQIASGGKIHNLHQVCGVLDSLGTRRFHCKILDSFSLSQHDADFKINIPVHRLLNLPITTGHIFCFFPFSNFDTKYTNRTNRSNLIIY